MRTMANRLTVFSVGAWALVLAASSATAATTEDVLAKIAKREADVTTFEADFKLVESEGGESVTGTGHVVLQRVVKDGKPAGTLVNQKMEMMTPDGKMTSLTVDDGQFLWMEDKRAGTPGARVIKSPSGSKAVPGNASAFREKYDLKLVKEDTLGGQKVWVLEGAPKEAEGPRGEGKLRMVYGQADQMCRRYALLDEGGKEMMSVTFTNAKANPKVDAKLFTYAPPAGARVIDRTKELD